MDEVGNVIHGPWGYAVVKDKTIYIPAIMGPMNEILDGLYKKTGITKMIFTAIINPEKFKQHLTNIKREYSEWVDHYGEYVPCIEIEYVPSNKGGQP